jgi:hypothetical protein
MKTLLAVLGFVLLLCPASRAFDIQDFLGTDTKGYTATGLDKIQNTIQQSQDSAANPFLLGIPSGNGPTPSRVKAIMDDFTMKGSANLYGQAASDADTDGGDNGQEDYPGLEDLLFFSGEGTGLFNPPEEAAGDWFAWPDDDWGWFYLPEDAGTWFNSQSWSQNSQ